MTKMLGPFLGFVTPNSIKIWLHREADNNKAYVTIHETIDGHIVASGDYTFTSEKLYTDCLTIDNLQPDKKYFYKIWSNPIYSIPIDLEGLEDSDLFFWTLPLDQTQQIDFLIMSCHNPTVALEDGNEGHAVWADIPQIISIDSNQKVRFALLVGDQIYADEWQNKLLVETDDTRRLLIYLEIYQKFWSHIHYRRVMCRLPSVMIWDDHDITDGWGSVAQSFVGNTDALKPEWLSLFQSASKAFSIMQASRNPDPLLENFNGGFDFAFKIGNFGFIALDLRSNRNVRKNQLMTPLQAQKYKAWVDSNKHDLRALFVISPVVFSHGSPVIDDIIVGIWPRIMRIVDWLAGRSKWGKGMHSKFYKTLGDIRDDIQDSWGSKENSAQADMFLDYLFNLQNDINTPISVVLLSGDIHTSGYANIYSSNEQHKSRSSIPHITSSSVAYVPFNWLVEAIYRQATKTVDLGKKRTYSSQISHHFCGRSVAVVSIRPKTNDDIQLKVKYYVEGFPEPHTLLFDLDKISHRENISWVAQDNLFSRDYAPSINFDIEASLKEKVRNGGQKLNIDVSVVDLMKALELESSLGARKRLAQQLGYKGSLDGSAEMNKWLHKQIMNHYIDNNGTIDSIQHLNG